MSKIAVSKDSVKVLESTSEHLILGGFLGDFYKNHSWLWNDIRELWCRKLGEYESDFCLAYGRVERWDGDPHFDIRYVFVLIDNELNKPVAICQTNRYWFGMFVAPMFRKQKLGTKLFRMAEQSEYFMTNGRFGDHSSEARGFFASVLVIDKNIAA